MAQNAVCILLRFQMLLTNIRAARRDTFATHATEPKARRSEHPHTVARERHNNTHFWSHIKQLFGEPKQYSASLWGSCVGQLLERQERKRDTQR